MHCQLAFVTVLVTLTLLQPINARIAGQCEVVKELTKIGVSKTFHSHWICLAKTVSGFKTDLVTGPLTASSYSYGIFQINSRKYCTRGRAGGLCNKKCEDFINDDISDDAKCAFKVFNTDGFKYWDGWNKKCKGQSLPAVNCKVERSVDLFKNETSDDEVL